MDPDTYPSSLALAVALLAANAYFTTAEFALLTLHRGHVEQISRDGDGRLSSLLRGVRRPEDLFLTAQLGRSVASLLLGYLAAVLALQWTALPGFADAGLVGLTILGVAMLHAAIGEQLPKLVGMHHADGMLARVVIPPLRLVGLLLFPLVWPLSRLISGAARLMSISSPAFEPLLHTPDEIRILVARGHEQGVVEEDEREMIHGIFDFSETVAREVMTPRIDIVAVPVDIGLDELIRVVVEEGHSRLPIYEGTIDTVVGVLLSKDLLPLLSDPDRFRDHPFDLRAVMREPYFVPDTKPVDDILAEFRQQKVHLAIVLDEFGGTYGLVTMEDLLEEIVGEINDEYDVAEPEFAPTPEGDVLIDGGAAISEVNERFGLALPEEDYDTIGGFVFGALGRVPVAGDEIGALGVDQDFLLHVEEIEDRRVIRVRLTRAAPVGEAVPEG